jgi:hypothetical protein
MSATRYISPDPYETVNQDLTFLCQSSALMALKLLFISSTLDMSITPRLRKRQLHRLIKQLKTLNFIDGLLRTLNSIKYNKSLSLSLQVCLRDDVDDFSIFGKELRQGFLELIYLDALFEIADVDAGFWLVDYKREGSVRVGVQ